MSNGTSNFQAVLSDAQELASQLLADAVEKLGIEWIEYYNSLSLFDAISNPFYLFPKANEGINVVVGFFEDVAGIPVEVLVKISAAQIEGPPALRNVVVTGDQAVRLALQLAIDAGFELTKGNLPPLFTFYKATDRQINNFKFFNQPSQKTGLRALKGGIVGMLILIVSTSLRVGAIMFVVLLAMKMEQEIQSGQMVTTVKQFSLSQDSKRSWIKRPGVRRTNVRTGPDR